MNTVITKLNSCFIGTNRAYLYILYSKSAHFAYVGETNGESGVIGRLYGHVKLTPSLGTLRTRVQDRLGIDLDEVGDLCAFSCSLPNEAIFTGVERVYRRGVEFLVQKKLWEICGNLEPHLRPIAHVDYSDAAKLPNIGITAQYIFNEFLAGYSKD